MMINIYAAWLGFLFGGISGAVPGLFFHKENWLGGYSSWSRRMIRLAHIAFWGIGLLNLSFGLTSKTLGLESGLVLPSMLLLIGAVAMPLVCYLSAWKSLFRNFFFIPATSVMLAIILFLLKLLEFSSIHSS